MGFIMLRKRLLVLILFLSMPLFFGCSDDDDDPVVDEFKIVTDAGDVYYTEYTTAGGMGVNVTIDTVFEWLTDDDSSNDPFIIDWRSTTDFDAGHIRDAVNWSLGDLNSKFNELPQDKLILNVCYTGQNASYATAVMNILAQDSDYSGIEAVNLKFGMCAVSTTLPNTDKWATQVAADEWVTSLETDAQTLSQEYSFPAMETGESKLAGIMNSKFSAADWTISAEEAFTNSGNYFTLNYWPEDRYLDPGHVPGAYQFTPNNDLKAAENLKYLPTDKTIIVYCYTGQTSAQVTAYLRLLGYDAKSLLYGANGFAFQEMVDRGWPSYHGPSNDYSGILEGSGATDEFALLANAGDNYFTNYTTSGGAGVNTTIETIFDLLIDGDDTNDPFFIDWRSADDYSAGHIVGAVNWTLADLPSKFGELPQDQLIVNICYTGQTASYATSVMNLLANDPAYSGIEATNLKFGMCAVSSTLPGTDKWETQTAVDEWVTALETAENALSEEHAFPTVSTGGSALSSVISGQFDPSSWTVSAEEVFTNSDNYFIANFWPTDRYVDPGHIPGAYCIQPKPDCELTQAANLKYLPTDKTIVVYCYTGQTSAQVTSYLRLLGYDAKSLTYGVNGFAFQEMVDRGWPSYHGPSNDYSGIIQTDGGLAASQ